MSFFILIFGASGIRPIRSNGTTIILPMYETEIWSRR